MKTVMVSGHFDPFHDIHLSYIEYAMNYGDRLLCIVSTDKQVLMKKGKVNIPEENRLRIVKSLLADYPSHVALNVHDKETSMMAEALRYWKPDVFCRGGDKTLEDMPIEEHKVCNDLHIQIVHAVLKNEKHGSMFV